MWRTNISYLPAKMTILITWRLFRDSNIPVIKRCQGEAVFEQIGLCVVNNINTVSGYGIVIDARIDPDSVSGGKGGRSRGNIIGNGSQVLGRHCLCIQKQSKPKSCLFRADRSQTERLALFHRIRNTVFYTLGKISVCSFRILGVIVLLEQNQTDEEECSGAACKNPAERLRLPLQEAVSFQDTIA